MHQKLSRRRVAVRRKAAGVRAARPSARIYRTAQVVPQQRLAAPLQPKPQRRARLGLQMQPQAMLKIQGNLPAGAGRVQVLRGGGFRKFTRLQHPICAAPHQRAARRIAPKPSCQQTAQQPKRPGCSHPAPLRASTPVGPSQQRRSTSEGIGRQSSRQPAAAHHRVTYRRRSSSAQTRLKISVPLVPPKPKLFFIAISTFWSRAVLAQKSKSHSGSWLSKLMVGGTFWW